MRMLIFVMLFSVSSITPAPAGEATGKNDPTAETPQSKEEAKRKWTVLFNGKDMKGWKLPKGFDYDDAGKVEVKDGTLVLNGGLYATGIRWAGKFPKMNYEVRFSAQRVDGYDFFAGTSFPVGDGALTLILGGWGGYVTGLSSIDGYRADENETCSCMEFKNKKWYPVRIRVTEDKVVAYVGDEKICDFETENRKLTVTAEMEPCLPFGVATWGGTTGALRNIRYRKLTQEELNRSKEE
ncbi:MAG: DUF1080 domain-containing protein [Pirellulaceae bacterium]